LEKSSGSSPSASAGTGLGEVPGLSAFNDSLEMMKRMWGFPVPGAAPSMIPGLGTLPSMFLPTVDVDELDKRIADLRSVEQWLNLNATMLRTTIQSLEVQRNTLAALRAFGGSMFGGTGSPSSATPGAPWPPAPAPTPAFTAPLPADPPATVPPEAPFNPAQWWTTLQDQFMRVAAAAMTDSAAQPPAEPDSPEPGAKAAAKAPGRAPGNPANSRKS
jgi:hypothetical protein